MAKTIVDRTLLSKKGTATNDSAAAGEVGEYVSSAQSTTSFPTSGNYGDLTSISLTAGDWDVTAHLGSVKGGATWTIVQAAISTTAGNSSSGLTLGDNWNSAEWASSSSTPVRVTMVIPAVRMSLSSTTTVYFKYYSEYSSGTPSAYGRISARRVR